MESIMKVMIISLIVAAVAAVLIYNKIHAAGKSAAAAAAQPPLRQELENRIVHFLEQDLFFLAIQPVVDFRTNAVTNGEALARLNHPERGVVFPNEFLPVIDALGLYPRFDRYIFRKCCAWLSRVLAEGRDFTCLSCNFSRTTLSEKGLARELISVADQYGLPHHKLAVEITEQEQATDARQLFDNLTLLKSAGFRIILDDFGDGVTSAKDLKYPLDIVKIDRSMLLDARTEPGRKAVSAVVAMARELNAEVVCEGIETEAQNQFARTAGCDYGQGFLFFKPIGQNEVFDMIDRSSILKDPDDLPDCPSGS